MLEAAMKGKLDASGARRKKSARAASTANRIAASTEADSDQAFTPAY
jgi:hypothetical protein